MSIAKKDESAPIASDPPAPSPGWSQFPDEDELYELNRQYRQAKWDEEARLYPIPDPFPPPYDGKLPPPGWSRIPDEDDLPESDGEMVENFSELPQAILLSDSIMPVLRALHPDGKFLVGSNSGIYWDHIQPPLRGMIGPDWLYVPGVIPTNKAGKRRKSYAMWREKIRPIIVMEFVSGNGSEELDRTPVRGKMWVYETRVKAKYYAIWNDEKGQLDCFVHVKGRYKPLPKNEFGRYPIPEMGVELGLWNGTYYGFTWDWMRWFLPDGSMLLISEEQVEAETRRAEEEARRAEAAVRRAQRLEKKLRDLGIDPDSENGTA